jgi:hypothetical protein
MPAGDSDPERNINYAIDVLDKFMSTFTPLEGSDDKSTQLWVLASEF